MSNLHRRTPVAPPRRRVASPRRKTKPLAVLDGLGVAGAIIGFLLVILVWVTLLAAQVGVALLVIALVLDLLNVINVVEFV